MPVEAFRLDRATTDAKLHDASVKKQPSVLSEATTMADEEPDTSEYRKPNIPSHHQQQHSSHDKESAATPRLHPPEPVVSSRTTKHVTVTVINDNRFPLSNGRSTRWKRQIRVFIPLITMVVIYCTVVVLFAIFQNRIFPVLENWAGTLRDLGVGGAAILSAGILVTAFPPIPGYSILVLFCGFVYGPILGFVPALIGAFLGGLASFVVFRYALSAYTQRLLRDNPKAALVVQAVENKGFKLLWLIRVAPYPYNLLNALLAASTVPFYQFALATLFSLPKLLLETTIGASVKSLSEGLLDHITWEKVVQLVVAVVVGLGVLLYVFLLARKVVRRYEAEQPMLTKA